VQTLARLDGASVWLDEGLFVVTATAITKPDALVTALRERGTLDRATLEAAVGKNALAVTTTLLATAHRNVRALATAPARAMAREHKKALARYGAIDDAWLTAKAERVEALADELTHGRPREGWFARVIELVVAVHGPRSAAALDAAAARLTAIGAERRKRAEEAVRALADALDGAPPPADLDALAERLERARELPGRARRTRVLDVLRKAIGWPEAPAEVVRTLAEPSALVDFPGEVRRAGLALAKALPAARDPKAPEDAREILALAGLRFRVGDDGVPLRSPEEVATALGKRAELAEIEGIGVTLAQALAVTALTTARYPRRKIARLVAEGLELDLVSRAAAAGQLDGLVKAGKSVRAARAFASWATRLVPHYKALGIDLVLSPELFANLPRNEDLGVLAFCLVETEKKPGADPIAILDATLGLFQKLPAKAAGILTRLRGTTPGAGRAAFPELAAWLDDDALLDRYVHLTRLAGLPVALSKRLREDFEHAEKSARERTHLEALASRSTRQEARLAAIRARDRSLAGAPRGRTRRRLAERVEALFPLAYRRELDATFRGLLADAWDIRVPRLTPAWRDAVRFWLVVDDNRELLGRLLRAAAAAPGRDVKRTFAKNRAWIDGAKFRVDAWLAPRRETLAGGLVLELEEDPLEVLRMGIPFGTCLALDTGFNAASTVVNAVDANKRVLYVRSREGKVLARKLLAVTSDRRMLGYNLYVSVTGAEEREIRAAVLRVCRTIADEAGLTFAVSGEPERLHGEFWYDDGAVPFDGDVDVAAYCRAIGLPPPPKDYDAIESEARGQAALGAGDVEAALTVLTAYDRGPANVRLGQWLVQRLGRREALRRSDDHVGLIPPLLGADDEHEMLASLDLVARLESYIAAAVLPRLVARFAPSARLASALAEAARRGVRSYRGEHGIAHLSFGLLPTLLEAAPPAFDALDRIEPVWAAVVADNARCASCLATAEYATLDALSRIDERVPDDDAITACLASRRRSELAHRAALRLASRRAVHDGARALERLFVHRPSLAKTPDALAATIRQARVDRLDASLERKLRFPDRDRAPFAALRDLLLSCEGLDRHLAPYAPDPATACAKERGWKPGPWELAYYRRKPDAALLAALRELDAGAPGDQDERERERRRRGEAAPAAPVPATSMKSRSECVAVARSLRDQVTASDAGRLMAITGTTHVDARLADLALAVLRGDKKRDDALAVEVLVASNVSVAPATIAADLAARGRKETAAALLAKIPQLRAAAPPDVVALWAHPDLRAPLAAALARTKTPDWAARAIAYERAGAEGLFDALALRFVEGGPVSFAADPESLDQLRAVMRIAIDRAPPKDAAELYAALPDALSAAIFLRTLAEAGPERLAAVRAAAAELTWKDDHGPAFKAWLDSTRLHKSRSSSIERG
jgi:hypothetical protein